MSAAMNKMTQEFTWADWIVAEREKRGWSQAELARRAGTTRQTINGYESRRRTDPDESILVNISKALGYGVLHLPRLAGLIPPETETDQETDDIVEAVADFSKREKQELLAYINFLKNQRKQK